jgi:hypothetical protein
VGWPAKPAEQVAVHKFPTRVTVEQLNAPLASSTVGAVEHTIAAAQVHDKRAVVIECGMCQGAVVSAAALAHVAFLCGGRQQRYELEGTLAARRLFC